MSHAPSGRGRAALRAARRDPGDRGRAVRRAGLRGARPCARSPTRPGSCPGSLYHHFDSKESMVDELLRTFLDEITGRLPAAIVAPPTTRTPTLRALGAASRSRRSRPIAATVAVMVNEWNLLRSTRASRTCATVSEETERLWVGVLATRRAHRARSAPSSTPRMTYRFIRDAIWMSVRWYEPDGATAPSTIADPYLDVLLDGRMRERRHERHDHRTEVLPGRRDRVARREPGATRPKELVEKAKRVGRAPQVPRAAAKAGSSRSTRSSRPGTPCRCTATTTTR